MHLANATGHTIKLLSMKQIYLLTVASIVFLSSCTKERITGSGSSSSEHRSINGFTSVQMSGSTNVIVKQGNSFDVQVQGYNNLLPYFETRVSNGVLLLGYKNNVNVDNDNIQVTVTLPVLSGLSILGSGDMQAIGNFTGSSTMEAKISGSGNILIEQGITENFYCTISGSGNIQAFGLQSRKAETNSSGSGSIQLSTTDELKVRISGSGDVYYKGNPAVSVQISGSGKVVKQ
jgi:hypothetical protein